MYKCINIYTHTEYIFKYMLFYMIDPKLRVIFPGWIYHEKLANRPCYLSLVRLEIISDLEIPSGTK